MASENVMSTDQDVVIFTAEEDIVVLAANDGVVTAGAEDSVLEVRTRCELRYVIRVESVVFVSVDGEEVVVDEERIVV